MSATQTKRENRGGASRKRNVNVARTPLTLCVTAAGMHSSACAIPCLGISAWVSYIQNQHALNDEDQDVIFWHQSKSRTRYAHVT